MLKATVFKFGESWVAIAWLNPMDLLSEYTAEFTTWADAIAWALAPRPL